MERCTETVEGDTKGVGKFVFSYLDLKALDLGYSFFVILWGVDTII